jgi:hypothetical protein
LFITAATSAENLGGPFPHGKLPPALVRMPMRKLSLMSIRTSVVIVLALRELKEERFVRSLRVDLYYILQGIFATMSAIASILMLLIYIGNIPILKAA